MEPAFLCTNKLSTTQGGKTPKKRIGNNGGKEMSRYFSILLFNILLPNSNTPSLFCHSYNFKEVGLKRESDCPKVILCSSMTEHRLELMALQCQLSIIITKSHWLLLVLLRSSGKKVDIKLQPKVWLYRKVSPMNIILGTHA